jgi:hypothetical protein
MNMFASRGDLCCWPFSSGRANLLLVAVQLRPGESGRRRSGAKSDNDKKLFERMFHNGSPERGPLELGPVRDVVGILRGVISGNMIISY